MSFSSILSQIKHKSKDSDETPIYTYAPGGQKQQTGTKPPTTQGRSSSQGRGSRPSSEPPRTIDPAVQRLKELRRLENAKKEAANPKPKTQRRSNGSTSSSGVSKTPIVRRRRAPETSIKENAMAPQRPRSSSPQKRLTFNELMEQGKVKNKSLSEGKKESSPTASTPQQKQYVSKTQPKAASQSRFERSKSAPSSNTSIRRPTAPGSVSSSRNGPSKPMARPRIQASSSQPKGYAKPSAELQAKLDSRRKQELLQKKRARQGYYDEDDYESDFIEDDDEEGNEEQDLGYDRDEIWNMFSRGKSRRDYMDYDDDLSDMEATGSEVLYEENASTKRAKLEEKAEAERERRRVEEKRRRLGK